MPASGVVILRIGFIPAASDRFPRSSGCFCHAQEGQDGVANFKREVWPCIDDFGQFGTEVGGIL
jgi:hypothetical protein